MRYTLGKQDRLILNKDIQQVFEYGKVLYCFPIKLVYHVDKNNGINNNLQCGFSVSKHLFHRANKRNRVKRLMRNSYRLQKHHIQTDKNLKMMMIYTHKDILNYQEIFEKINSILGMLNKKII